MAEITSEAVTQALGFWALVLAGAPKIEKKEDLVELGFAYLLVMKKAGVSLEEWLWVREFIPGEPGRKFFPKTPEILDLIRERRRRHLDDLVGIGVERDGKTSVEWKHPSELPDPQVEAGPRVALPDLSKLGSKVVRS